MTVYEVREDGNPGVTLGTGIIGVYPTLPEALAAIDDERDAFARSPYGQGSPHGQPWLPRLVVHVTGEEEHRVGSCRDCLHAEQLVD